MKKTIKNILIYIAGVVTGVVLVFLIAFIVGSNTDKGKTLFKEEGECISEEPFKVFEVTSSGDALAYNLNNYGVPTGLIVLFLNEEGKAYYDGQIIEPPTGKCAKQIGVFKYTTNKNLQKTIPIVAIR